MGYFLLEFANSRRIGFNEQFTISSTFCPIAGSQILRNYLIASGLEGGPVCPVARNNDKKKIRCVVAHDIAWLRQGVRRLLDDTPDIDVVAEAEDEVQTLREVFTHRPE